MTLRVKPVSGRRELATFISLPRHLYAGIPGFVPPLDFERRHMLHPKYAPLFDRAEIQYWIAWRGDRPVGRISAQIDPVTIEAWGEPAGMFGCLDAIDDAAVVGALIRTAAEWLAARGMKRMRGPFLLSINGEAGLMIEGQVARAMILSPWHPAYLGAHVETAGLSGIKDLLSFNLTPPEVGGSSKARIPKSVAGQLSLRTIDLKRFEEECAVIRRLFNDAWHDNWGFVPFTDREFGKIAKSLRPLAREQSVVFVEKDDREIAFLLALPNTYDMCGDLDGRLWPLNWLKFGWRLYRRSFRSGRVLMIGIESDVQYTILGGLLPMLMIEELVRRNSYPMDMLEMGWILEDNARVQNLIEAYGGTVSKRFRLYETTI